MDSMFTPNKTCARLLVDYAAAGFGRDVAGNGENGARRLMVYDPYIEARSDATVNNIAFGRSILSGLFVPAWPPFAAVVEDFGWQREFLKSAILSELKCIDPGFGFHQALVKRKPDGGKKPPLVGRPCTLKRRVCR